jgi:hypothetical protein
MVITIELNEGEVQAILNEHFRERGFEVKKVETTIPREYYQCGAEIIPITNLILEVDKL